MIYRLRKKFIGICILSFLAVFAVVFALIFLITVWQTGDALDRQADLIAQNDGNFPDFNEMAPGEGRPMPPEGFNRESPFTTRYFTVHFDEEGRVTLVNTQKVASVTQKEAEAYAKEAAAQTAERGWLYDYRYKRYDTLSGEAVVFVSGVDMIENNRNFLVATLSVFMLCCGVVIVLIVFISKRAVKPSAESYEKQKQFVTNASHELKTPLTLIRTNLDILESETGKNEWLSDIREETMLMSELVNQMVTLARMDEDGTKPDTQEFSLSDAVTDIVSAFLPAVENSGRRLTVKTNAPLFYRGDEAGIRQVVLILMDNALKYCDKDGEIKLSLAGDRHPTLTVENSYSAVGNVALDRLFERFYRADKARTYGTGFGIGLSMAKAIVEKHRGSITAYQADKRSIGFKVKL